MDKRYACEGTLVHQEAVEIVLSQMQSEQVFNDAASFFKVMGDGTRFRILYALDKQELCVCDLANLLNMSVSAVSHQLARLRESKLVKSRRDGKNVFFDEKGPRGLSKEAYGFIAGILAHVRGFAAITNPLVNSYKRLVPGYEAPVYLAWSASNRSALIRIPAARGQSTRLELCCLDPACNPYLALAVCLAAGLEGIEKELAPPPETTENIFAMDAAARAAKGIPSLPGSLEEAIKALEEDPLVREALGEHVFTNYVAGKRKEWDEYRTQVSHWELDRYLVSH